MHDAKMVSLSKIEVGQLILVTPDTPRGFGRPKDTTAIPLRVTAKDFVPDDWSGKVWTLTLDDGTKTEGRYGTTHVYVFDVAPWVPPVDKPAAPKLVKSKGKDTPLSDVKRGDYVLVGDDSATPKQYLAKLPPAGEPAQVIGIMYHQGETTLLFGDGWHGKNSRWYVVGHADVEPIPHPGRHATKGGRPVEITADGVVTVLSDDELDERNAGEPDLAVLLGTERCPQCKGFEVVRKRGTHAGKAYRTLGGSQAATTNGNSEPCPKCAGTGLVARAA